MLPQLTEYLLNAWPSSLSSFKRPNAIHYLGVFGSVEGGTTTFLAFLDQSEKPAFVVKIHRNKAAEKRALNEYSVLQKLQSIDDSIAASVPQLVLCEKISDCWIIVQTIVEGIPMTATLNREAIPAADSARKNVTLAADWLGVLDQFSRRKDKKSQDSVLNNGQSLLQEFSSVYPLSSSEERFLHKIDDSLSHLSSFGTTLQHGDFCRHNILVDKKKSDTFINIIDWTDAQLEGFPTHDLLFFLSTYFLQIRKHPGMNGFIKAFEISFFSENSYSLLIQNSLREFCHQSNIPSPSIRTLFSLLIIRQSLHEYKKLVSFSKEGGIPRFTLQLAISEGKTFTEALKEQIWVYFFRFLVQNEGRLLFE